MNERCNTNMLRGPVKVPAGVVAMVLAVSGSISHMLVQAGSARGLVPPTVFKTAVSSREVRGVGSIPMRFRQPFPLVGFEW